MKDRDGAGLYHSQRPCRLEAGHSVEPRPGASGSRCWLLASWDGRESARLVALLSFYPVSQGHGWSALCSFHRSTALLSRVAHPGSKHPPRLLGLHRRYTFSRARISCDLLRAAQCSFPPPRIAMRSVSVPIYLRLALAMLIACASCGEPQCPDGFDKVGKVCRRHDASIDPAVTADGGSEDDEDASTSTASETARDAAVAAADARDGGAQPSMVLEDARTPDLRDATQGTTIEAGVEPMPECGPARACGMGYTCDAGKCVSACAQKQCDPNATCSLMNGAPVCTCNSGYIATSGSGGAVVCTADRSCAELGCHTNSTCLVGADQLRRCACKSGYSGDGRQCTPVSCPAASTLSIPNGTVTTPNGAVYNQTANYACNAGHRLVGMATRLCGAEGTWAGAAPSCEPRDCGALTNPARGRVDTSGGTTVGSAAARYTCDSNYTLVGGATRTCQGSALGAAWSGSAPRCLGCGDGIVSTEIDEECEPRVGGASAWTCNSATCKRSTIYTYCSSVSDCTFGESCGTQAFCSRSCAGGATCPAVPAGVAVSVNAACQSSACIAQGCNTHADCAAGLVC